MGRTGDTEPNEDRISIECNSCGGETWHRLLYTHSKKIPVIEVEQAGPDETAQSQIGEVEERWELFQCLGCDSMTVRIGREDFDEEIMYFTYLPDRSSWQHKARQYRAIPHQIKKIYLEVITAFDRRMPVLCSGGLRALLEGICRDRGIERGITDGGQVKDTLEGKINALVSIVPENIVKNLHSVRFFGNTALHELDAPDRNELELAITVMEDIMNVIYDLDYQADQLSQRAARREKSRRAVKKPKKPRGMI